MSKTDLPKAAVAKSVVINNGNAKPKVSLAPVTALSKVAPMTAPIVEKAPTIAPVAAKAEAPSAAASAKAAAAKLIAAKVEAVKVEAAKPAVVANPVAAKSVAAKPAVVKVATVAKPAGVAKAEVTKPVAAAIKPAVAKPVAPVAMATAAKSVAAPAAEPVAPPAVKPVAAKVLVTTAAKPAFNAPEFDTAAWFAAGLAAAKAASALQAKMLDHACAELASTLGTVEELAQQKSASDLVIVQSKAFRRSFESLTLHLTDLGNTARSTLKVG